MESVEGSHGGVARVTWHILAFFRLRAPEFIPWTLFQDAHMGFPEMKGTILEVPIIRIIVNIGVNIGVTLFWEITTSEIGREIFLTSGSGFSV